MPVAFDTEIIARHPIGTGLDDFRLLLKSRCDELGISGVEDHESRISQLVLNSGMAIEEYLNEHHLLL